MGSACLRVQAGGCIDAGAWLLLLCFKMPAGFFYGLCIFKNILLGSSDRFYFWPSQAGSRILSSITFPGYGGLMHCLFFTYFRDSFFVLLFRENA